MEVKMEKGYISIVSPKFTRFCGLFSGYAKSARAAAIFPFIIFRSMEEKVPWIINHERIHFRQQLETAFLSFICSFFEMLYARIILHKNAKETYLWLSSEQEAYRNQHDPDYLSKRPLWARFKYLRNKKIFTLGNPPEIVFIDDSNASQKNK